MTDVQYDADLHGRSFAQMQVFYTAQKKQFEPLSYEFLIAFGQSALREGRIRQAIERTREAISRAQTSRERSEAYLYLCRMYRVMLHMNNARSELHRAFDELRIPEPASRLSALLKALVFAVFDPRRPFARVLDTIDAEEVARRYALIMGLYVESGLSSYYLRKFVPFLQASLWSRVVFLFGPPAAKAEWAGGTGTVLAVLHFKSASDRLLNLTEDIARDIGSASVQAKTQIWRALSADYFGDPMRSAELFSKLAHERAQDLSTEDLGIVCTTLSNNYVIRGHTEESLRAIEALFTEYDRSCTLFFSCRKTFVEWYKIPALSFHGQNEEVETIIKTSRGIFSSVDEEKWQVAQYLGNLLIHLYLQKSHDFEQIEYVLKRFQALKMSPRQTFLEACHYWVARAYIMVELHRAGKIDRKRFEQAVRDLGRVPRHPSLQAHWAVLKAHEAALRERPNAATRYQRRAEQLAKQHDNRWVMYEVGKCGLYIAHLKDARASLEPAFETLAALIHEWGWRGCESQLERLRAHLGQSL